MLSEQLWINCFIVIEEFILLRVLVLDALLFVFFKDIFNLCNHWIFGHRLVVSFDLFVNNFFFHFFVDDFSLNFFIPDRFFFFFFNYDLLLFYYFIQHLNGFCHLFWLHCLIHHFLFLHWMIFNHRRLLNHFGLLHLNNLRHWLYFRNRWLLINFSLILRNFLSLCLRLFN